MEAIKKVFKKEIKELRETKYREQNGLNDKYVYTSNYTLKLVMPKKQMENNYGTIKFDYYEKECIEVKEYLEAKYPELKFEYVKIKNWCSGNYHTAIKFSK